MAGFLEKLGIKSLNAATDTAPLNWGKIGIIILCVFVFVIVSVVVFSIIWNKHQKKRYNKKIEFAKDVNGQVYLTGEDWARELKLPGTSVKVFLLKARGSFSPKLIYTIGENRFLIFIGPGGEWSNTNLRYGLDGVIEINDKLKPTRDYANENLKDLIDEHWTNKNKNWLKDNMALIFLIIICCLIILALIINGVQEKKSRAAYITSANAQKEAANSYAQAQIKFIEFLEENFIDSGVKPVSTTGG